MIDDPFTDPPAAELADGGWFTDPPALPEPQGLQRGDCRDCGALALVDAQYVGDVRCSACWSKFHRVSDAPVPRRGALTHVVVVPRVVRGELSAPLAPEPDRTPLGDVGTLDESVQDSIGRWRVIVPARDCR